MPRRISRRESGRRFFYALILLVSVVWIGTVGYMLIEGWPVLDSLYMTIITMATVGYGETRPLSDAGRMFTIGLIITSIGIAGYALSTLAAFVVEGEFYRIIRERRMDQRITHLTDHIILCGGGHTGKHIAQELHHTRTPFVLIERDPDMLPHILQVGDFPYLLGDATEDETLLLAGIERARGLVAALGQDKENVFIVLTARQLNPSLRIIARVTEEANMSKLRRAGADEVISPNAIGGLRMASVVLRPTAVNFLDELLRAKNQTLRVDELVLAQAPSLVGKTIAEADLSRKIGVLIVAIRLHEGGYLFNPPGNTVFRADDTLIVMGPIEKIAQLREMR